MRASLVVAGVFLIVMFVLLWQRTETPNTSTPDVTGSTTTSATPARLPSVAPSLEVDAASADIPAKRLDPNGIVEDWDYAGPVSTEPATLRGRVVRDGKPVPEFWIYANKGPIHITSPAGEFQISVPGNTAWSVYVVAKATAAWEGYAFVPPHTLKDMGVIELVEADTIIGTVLDRNNFPVPDAEVSVRCRSVGISLSLPRTARTDAHGKFEALSYGGEESVFVVSERGNGTAVVRGDGTVLVHLVSADELPAQ